MVVVIGSLEGLYQEESRRHAFPALTAEQKALTYLNTLTGPTNKQN